MTLDQTTSMIIPQAEMGGWLSFVQTASDSETAFSPGELLAQAASRWRGNVRFARSSAGLIIRGELPLRGTGADREAATARLQDWFQSESRLPQSTGWDEDEFETILLETGWPVSRREEAWFVSPATGRPFEMAVVQDGEDVRVRCTLVEIPESDDGVRQQALAEYALLAHGQLRFVRVEIDNHSFQLASVANIAALEDELRRSFEVLADAGRRLLPQVQALAESTSLAESYLSMAVPRSRAII